MRFFPLLAFAILTHVPLVSAAAEEDFGGAWVAWLCPKGVQRESGLCSNFVLELHQRNGRLCGAHTFATAGATEVDEGAAPSVTGDVTDGAATVVVVSTRTATPTPVRVEMKQNKGVLHWQRQEKPSGNYLLPESARMTRARQKTLFAPLFAQQLMSRCLAMFTALEQRADRQGEGTEKLSPETVPPAR